MAATVYLTRRVTFSASHRLHSPELDEAENKAIFGKCNNLHGHGHNYSLEVTVHGTVDPTTGMVMNLTDLKHAMETEILDRVDHKHLNLDVPIFEEIIPTAENMAVVFWHLLEKVLPNGFLYEVRLQETENNVAVYRGE